MQINLKHYRVHFGYKQKEFAEIIGVSVSHMCMLESGKRTPSLELAYKISDKFDLSVEDIWVK
jgi:putative transcriptional regulator